jgi:hypothetical protein
MNNWPDQSGNNLKQTYIQGFLDISGGDINLRNQGNLFIGNNSTVNGSIEVSNNSIFNGNVTIGKNTISYFQYNFEPQDFIQNENNIIQAIPAPGFLASSSGSNSILINNQTDSLGFINGTYNYYSSSNIIPNYPYNVFNGTRNLKWTSDEKYYNGSYVGTAITNYNRNTQSILGEWIEVKLPY